MSSGTEFARWLRRPEKAFSENFLFALKAWQSADFTLSDKYELILTWISEHLAKFPENNVPYNELIELLKLRAQPGLINEQTKRIFVRTIVTLCETKAKKQPSDVSILPQLLQHLSEFELLQDLFHADYDLHANVLGVLLHCYEVYLQQFSDEQHKTINVTTETDFFSHFMSGLQNDVKKTGDAAQYDKSFCKHTLKRLVKVLLVLRSREICFFDEFIQLERLLTDHYTDKELVERISAMPLFVRLMTSECSIVNRRGFETFLSLLLQHIFEKFPPIDLKIAETSIPYTLTAFAYILEALRKHDLNLNFSVSSNNPIPLLTYLGQHLLPCVQKFKKEHLREVLLLLCAALRLNPLIIEQDIFQVTTWMIVAEKNTTEEQELFEEYLALLMDMFRRLSRVEKLVFNLLKSLTEWLNNFELTSANKDVLKQKRKANVENEIPAKKNELNTLSTSTEIDFYLQIIFQQFHKKFENEKRCISYNSSYKSFPYMRNAWPSATVGTIFSKLITGLVSKPSLVIWKSLRYSLKELLERFQQSPEITQQGNSLFLLDLHAALLCQYFNGCRLVEQWDKFAEEITEQCKLTAEVFAEFGRFLQMQEYNKRLTSAFLECVYHFVNFELILTYYIPDGYENKFINSTNDLYSFLAVEDWFLLQQRVLNFGKSNCKFLFDRLMLQRVQAQAIVQPTATTDLQKEIKSSAKHIFHKEISSLLQRVPSAHWFTLHLKTERKIEILQALIHNTETISYLIDDLKSLEILATTVYMKLSDTFVAASKESMLYALNTDFPTIHQNMVADSNTSDKQLQKLIKIIERHAQTNYKLKVRFPEQDLQELLQLLKLLPLGHLRRQSKNYIFALHMAIYSDTEAAELQSNEIKKITFEILIDLLHFGEQVHVFKYFNFATILRILPAGNCWSFYEYIFNTIKNEEKGTEQFLTAFADLMETSQNDDGKLCDDYRRLMLIAIETLSTLTGPKAKRVRKYFERILYIFAKYVTAHFEKRLPDENVNTERDKKFVEKTLAGFGPYANALLNKAGSAIKSGIPDQSADIVDENFRRTCKVYIGHSMDYRNPHAVRLMQVALIHRQLLHLDQDEIEFVLNHYWQQLNIDLKTQSSESHLVKTTETTVKMIIDNKTNEDLLLTLQGLGTNIDKETDFKHVLRCLKEIAKCPFSRIKGAIFNEKFKDITYNIIIRLAKDEQQQFIDKLQVLTILAAQKSVIENKMIPISIDTLDDILAFLMDINIKQMPLFENNLVVFQQLHLGMCELLSALIRQRHVLLMDRVPQFMHIFKDLLQSIVWYKSDRQKDSSLSAIELDDLTELALKLEALMHLISAHSLHVKRIAPFVLTFAINLMVGNKRATTLYPKIKTHVENICYDLIGICDHRVGRFILRCSNEAAREVYEILVKDHKKYHKFKGKI